MKNLIFPSLKLKFIYSLILLQIILYSVFRVAFLLFFKNELTDQTVFEISNSLFLGLRFDLRLAMFVLIPGLLLINLPLNPLFKSKLTQFFYTILFTAITFLYIVDAGYFAYLKSRLNATVIEFIKNPLISANMIHESYPWPILLGLLIIMALYWHYMLKKFVVTHLYGSPFIQTTKTKFLSVVIFIIVFALGSYGSFKNYPLRWSEAFASTNVFSSNLSLNPILYVADTYTFRKAEFDKTPVLESYELMANFLGVQEPNKESLNFVRSFAGDTSRSEKKPNIVVIVMESMAYYKTGIGGSAVNPTPYLDELSRDSLLFTNFYTPTVATARSIFAAVTSLPDTSKVKTGSRNPFIVNQHTIMGEFHNYDKYYFLGGSANWGNIRGVFSYNIPGLKIFEEGSYKSPRVDVWGISDLDLFKESHVTITQNNLNKPFFAFIQTAGFHRPYTIPQNNDGFVVMTPKDISEKEIRDYGFESFEEYNAMRLQDHSLGKFMEMAKKEKWYDNTIFFIFGDHALPHNNALNVPNWKKSLLNGFHVPFIIHSPTYITPGIEKKIASELDVMPTIAGLAGIPYQTRALGRDLFDPRFDDSRVAFSYNWYAPFHLSLVDKDFYFEYIPYSYSGKLIKHTESNEDIDVKDQYPDKYKEMEKLTKGFYETARYLLHNNPKITK